MGQPTERGWIGPDMCILCRNAMESSTHLLLHCDYAVSVWVNCMRLANLPASQNTRLDFSNTTHMGRGRKSMYFIVIAAVYWNVWKESNRRIFSDLATSSDSCTLQPTQTFYCGQGFFHMKNGCSSRRTTRTTDLQSPWSLYNMSSGLMEGRTRSLFGDLIYHVLYFDSCANFIVVAHFLFVVCIYKGS